jgi:peptidyl-prolyl cis-trans isomerase SurA
MSEKLLRLFVPCVLLVLLSVSGLQGQAETVLIDRIVAIVGSDIILQSELQEHLYITSQQLGISPEDSTELLGLRSKLLDGLITEKVILQQAREKDITVSDEEVDAAIDKDIQAIRARFDSEEEFQDALREEGFTLQSYRESMREEREKQLLQEKFMQQLKLPPRHVSDEEIEAYFEENRDSFGLRPATVKLAHILLVPEPPDSVVRAKKATVDEILRRLREGVAFEDLAREYSDDESTKYRGGDIGFLERGDMLPEIERVVFLLDTGEVSGAIRTDIGYFIVKVEEIRLGKIHLKQIHDSMQPTEEDRLRTEQLAYQLVDSLRNGADFEEFVERYSDDESTAHEGGLIGEFTIENIPDRYLQAIEGLESGDVSDPVETDEGWEILKVLEKNPPRPYELEDVKENIRQLLSQQKAFDEFVEKMKEKTYIEIRL